MSQRPLTPTGPPGQLVPRSRKTAPIDEMAVGATPMPGVHKSPSRLRGDEARPRLDAMPPPRESAIRRRGGPRSDDGTEDGAGTSGSTGSRSRSPSQNLSPSRDLEPSPARRSPPVPGLMGGEYAMPGSSPMAAGTRSSVRRSTNEPSGHGQQLSARHGYADGASPGSGMRTPPERSQAQIWAGPMGTAPVAIGMASSIRTFLKGLDVAGACCVGALLGAQSGPADFFKPHIHYSLHKQAYMVPLPNSYLPSMDHVELLNPHVAAVSLPPSTMGEEATGSPVVDAFLRDIPALQGFLRRFMSDANFVPPELRHRKRKPVLPEDHLRTSHYMLDMHREGIGINMYLKRPLPRYPLQQAGGWSYGRTKRQAPDPSVNRIVDTYLLKPSFCGGTELLCQIAYQDPNARERGGRRGRDDGDGDGGVVNEIQGVMTRKTALPLSCSVDEVVALIQGNLDQMIVPVTDLTCFQAVIMSLCGLPQVRDEEAAEATNTTDQSINSAALVSTARSAAHHTTGSTDTDVGTTGLGLLEPGMAFTNSVMLQRLVQSRTFTRLLWRAIRRRHAPDPDPDLEVWHLRCLLLPSEVRLLRAVARDEPELTPDLLVEELRCVSHAIQAAPTARANALEGLCTTLWEELENDPCNGPLLTSVRRLVKHVPAFLESCIHGRGVSHAATLWWKAREGGDGYAYLHRLCKAAGETRPAPNRASFHAISEFDMVEFTAAFDLPEEEEDEPPAESSDDETQGDDLGNGEGGEGRLGSGLRRHTSESGDDTPTGRSSALSARFSAASAGSDGGGRAHPPSLIKQSSVSNFVEQGDVQLSARVGGEEAGGQGGELAKSVYKAKNAYPVKPLRRLGPGALNLLGGSSNCVVPGVALPERGPLASGRQSLSARVLPGTASGSNSSGNNSGSPALSELRVSELHRMSSGKHLQQYVANNANNGGGAEGGVVSSHRSSVAQTSRSSLSEDTELVKADTPMGRASEGSGTARGSGSGSSQREHGGSTARDRDHGLPPTGREGHASGPTTARGSENSPHTARSSGLVVGPMGRRVPKLTIKPITQAAAASEEPNASARAGQGPGAPFASSRAPLSAGASPLYTTRSSRRYAAVTRGASAISNQRGRSASSAFIYSSTQGAKGALANGPLPSSRGIGLGESIGRAQTYMLRATGAPEQEQLDVTQVKFHLLAKKVGQSYVASDLWALMETQRREGRALPGPTSSGAVAITSARSPSSRNLLSGLSGVAEDPFASAGYRSSAALEASTNSSRLDPSRRPQLVSMGSRRALSPTNEGANQPADRRRSAILEPTLAFWIPDESSVLHWPAGEAEAHRVLRGGDTEKGDLTSSLPLEGSQKGSNTPVPGGPSQNLKLLRDLCLNLAQFPHADTMGDLEEVALVLVDEMLSGLRSGSSGGKTGRAEVLDSMYDVVLTQSTAASPDVELPSALVVPEEPAAGDGPSESFASSEKGLGLAALEQGPQHIPPTQDGLAGTHGSVASMTGTITGGGTGGATGGVGQATKRTMGDEPIVAQIQSRLRRLTDVTDALQQCLLHASNNGANGLNGNENGPPVAAAGGNNNAQPPHGASAILRARLCLLQRWVACDRLALAKLLFKHMSKALSRGRLTWPLIARVVELCRRCVGQLKISDPHARAKFPTQGGALLLEEAGFFFWILRTVDLLCDACCRNPSACLQLVGVLHEYIEAVREALASVLFYLHLPPRVDTLVCNSLGSGAKDRAFCTPLALARVRLGALSHINRCIDLCRSAMRWHSREIDGNGAKASDMDHKTKLQQIVSDFHKLNLFLNSDLVHRVASVTTDRSGLKSARILSDATNTDDPRLTVGILWALGKVVSMEDERHLQRRDWADQAIFHHFTALIKNYAAAWDPHKRLLCKLHLRVLLSLVLYRHPSVLSKCFQLRVLHFFVHEISSEMRCGLTSSSIPPSSAPRTDRLPTEAMTLPARNTEQLEHSLPSVGSLKNFGQTLKLSSTARLRSPKGADSPTPRLDKPGTPSPFKSPPTSPKQAPKPSLQPSSSSSPRATNSPVPTIAMSLSVPKMAPPPMSVPKMALPQAAVPQAAVPQTAVPQMALPQLPVPKMAVPQMVVPATPSPINAPLVSSPAEDSPRRRLSASAPLAGPGQSPSSDVASSEPLVVGDRVDGLVTLKSGRQRWFPGRITAVSLSKDPSGEVRYGVTYDDGDVEVDKPPSDVRQSRSQRSPQPGAQNGHTDTSLRRVQSASAMAPPTLPSGPLRPLSLTPSALHMPRPKLMLGDRSAADSTSSGEPPMKPLDLNLRVAIPTAAGSITPVARSPNPVASLSPDSRAAKKGLNQALKGATSLPDPSEHGSSDDDYEDEDEEDDVFAIPSNLPGPDRRDNLLSMKLAFPMAGFGLNRETAGQLGGSLSASLLSTDAEAAAEMLKSGPPVVAPPGPLSAAASAASAAEGSGHGKDPREASIGPAAEPPSTRQPALDYGEQRKAIALYCDAQLQELVLLLVLNLCVATDRVTLESRYCSQLPFSNGHGSESVGFNVLYALYCHLSHPENARVVPRLRSHVAQFGKAASRLFKLVCEGIFDMRLYSHGQEILAKGAFGTVMSVKSPVNLTDGVPDSDRSVSHGDSSLTVKLIPHEVSAQDRCVTFDVFSEVSALETLAHSPYVCRLYDYGISGGKFWLVMERCRSSLKAWRTEQMPAKPSDKDIMLYLHVFSKILEGVQTLHHEGIAHFDLKCDNIFIREREGPEPKDARFHVPFHVCIGDFGEAQIGSSRTEDNESDVEDDEADRRILQGRGTEAIQSPEMLLIGAKNRKDAAGYDRRKRVTVGCASDVWSLGCLLYELLTGEFLFVYSVWAEFFVQLTSSNSRILPPERMLPLRESLSPEVFSMVERLLEYMLVRSADRRPRVDMVRRQLQLVVQALSKKVGMPTQQTPYRRRLLVAPKTESPPTLKPPPKLVAQDSFTSRLAGMSSPDNMWLPHVSGHESYPEGLWRLSTDVYVGCVAKWENFLQPGHNFHELMGEVDPNESTALPAPINKDEPVMCFSAAFLPDLWTERQWLTMQRVPAYHLGITRVLFVTEASSSYHHPNAPLLSLVEKDLRDVEVMISLQKNIRLTVGATGATGGAHRSRASQHNGKSAAGQPSGTQNLAQGRTPVTILQINSRTDGATTHEQLAKLLSDSSATLDRVADFMLCRDHRTRGCAVIVTSASDQPSSLPHVLASTVAALCSIRAPDAPPTLYECLMRAKTAYPRLALTPHFVEVLQHVFQRDSVAINMGGPSKNNRA